MSRRRITIFEGPDGSGKSTAAIKFAVDTNARYVHCGPFPGLAHIGRLYLEAMMPALDGYQDVVMDRCWLSEPIYGAVHRGGQDRLGVAGRRMLERVAMRCATSLIIALPGIDTCLSAFRQRRGQEYLDDEAKLRRVYQRYVNLAGEDGPTDLDPTVWDYTDQRDVPTEMNRCLPHGVNGTSVGSSEALVILVGERPGPVKPEDGLHQYPFVSFSNQGCSRWLTEFLQDADIRERDLMWINAFAPGAQQVLFDHPGATRIALGDEAAKQLDAIDPGGVRLKVSHPQRVKRFGWRNQGNYELARLIKEAIR